MLKKNTRHRVENLLFPVLFFAGMILLWEFLVTILNVPEYALPKPSRIIIKIFTNLRFFVNHASLTMMEAAIGFATASLLSFFTAVIFVHSKIIAKTLYPFAVSLKTIPMIALAPLLILWLGMGVTSKIAIVTITCFFPLLVNSVKGLETVDREQLDLFRSLQASKWQIFIKLRLPNSLSYIFPAMKTSAIIAVLGAIVGEFVGANAGIGYIILISTYSFNTLTVFAAIIMTSLIGLLFFGIITLIEKRVVFWQKSD